MTAHATPTRESLTRRDLGRELLAIFDLAENRPDIRERVSAAIGLVGRLDIESAAAHATPTRESLDRVLANWDREAAASHPDDGHEHWFACVRCGVDNGLNSRADHSASGIAVEGLREAATAVYEHWAGEHIEGEPTCTLQDHIDTLADSIGRPRRWPARLNSETPATEATEAKAERYRAEPLAVENGPWRVRRGEDTVLVVEEQAEARRIAGALNGDSETPTTEEEPR